MPVSILDRSPYHVFPNWRITLLPIIVQNHSSQSTVSASVKVSAGIETSWVGRGEGGG